MPYIARAIAAGAVLLLVAAVGSADQRFQSELHDFRVATVVEGLNHPWAMAFLPNGDILVTERAGRLRIIRDGRLLADPVAGLPDITAQGQGGLLDITLHPAFQDNRLLYLSYAASGSGGYGTEVARGRYRDGVLEDVEVIFRALPREGGGRHFGSRLVFDNEGYLYVTLGDRGQQATGQDLTTHTGSIIRIRDDGSVPDDNPFTDGERPEIFSYGHRNVQGAALHPDTGVLWTHEHGPQGGDELNIVRRGANYGWPVITYGVNYGSGTKIGEGTEKPGMEQPLWYWVPSIAPSGMTFYTGDRFPAWRNSVFVGALKFELLARLELDGDKVVNEERMLEGAYGRIRAVAQGPDGNLYLLTDEGNGSLLRIEPDG
jgi:aldose sugar dehydrogenase